MLLCVRPTDSPGAEAFLKSGGKWVPVVSESGKRIPAVSESGKWVPVVSESGKRIPVVSESGKWVQDRVTQVRNEGKLS